VAAGHPQHGAGPALDQVGKGLVVTRAQPCDQLLLGVGRRRVVVYDSEVLGPDVVGHAGLPRPAG